MNDILQYAVDNGIINLRGVAEEVELKKLESHHIWKGKNGYYYSKVNGKLYKRKNLEDLNNVLLNIHDKQTVQDTFDLFLDNKRNLQPSSIYRYKSTFKSYFDTLKDKPVDSITEYDIETFITNILNDGIKSKEYAGIRTVLNGIFKLARKQRLIDFRISETLEDLNITHNDFKIKQHKKQVLNTKEYELIIEYLKDNQDLLNIGLLLLLKTGLRIGELVALTPQDIGKGFILVNKTEQKHDGVYEIVDKTKTQAGTRQVVLAESDTWILTKLRFERAFSKRLFGFRTYQFRTRLYTVCDKLGIERIGLHALRKTYASRLFKLGLDEQFICSQLGHTDITCTKQYYIKDTLTLDEKKRLLKVT